MPEEFDHHRAENSYSSFWPVLILTVGLLIWFGIQDYGLNSQRVAYNKQFQDSQFQTALGQAQNISTHYKALMSDLYQTAQKDPVAAQIVKDAIQTGMLRVQAGATTNSTSSPAEPAK